MAYGFRCKNDFGTMQIDDTYCNLALTQQGVWNPASSGTVVGLSKQQVITVSGENPVIFLKPPTGAYCSVIAVSSSGSSWSFTLETGSSINASINWYIFDNPPDPGIGGYGMRIRRGDNKITFHTAHKYLKIVNFAALPDINSWPWFTTPYSAFGANGMTLAAMFTDPGIAGTTVFNQAGGVISAMYPTPMFSFDISGPSANIIPRARVFYTIPPGSAILNNSRPPQGIIFADVTAL